MIIDPATLSVTHLVIDPEHGEEHGRLVPLDLVDTATGEIGLRCTLAEFGRLDRPRRPSYLEVSAVPGSAVRLPRWAYHTPRGPTSRTWFRGGETAVGRGEHVHALDGEIGEVEGFLVDAGDHRVTHVLLREGHFWGRKEVAIPVSAVTRIQYGIRLNLTKQQIEDLPSAD